jgi:(R,R)-butanediol dehydrogenase/meso-butanediol dehydrogenase/diacetyl reductase
MRAVVLHGAGDLRVEERPIPDYGPGDLLLKITTAGICGTDAAFYRLGADAQPKGAQVACPVVLGHEFAGTVVAAGADVTSFAVGDLAVSGASIACLRCAPCRAGNTNMCLENRTAGIHRDGGLAEYCAIPAWSCEPAGAHGISGDDAALAQPMSIAHHGVHRGRLRAGERALMIGVGGIGMFATWIAAQLGAEVTAVDLDAERLALAAGLGATTVQLEPGARLTDVLEPGAFDVIYEVTGTSGALQDALALVGRGTRVVLIGVQKGELTFTPGLVTAHEIELLGSAAQIRGLDLPAAIALVAARSEGWADIAPTALPLEDVHEHGIVPIAERRAAQVKVLVDPAISEPRAYSR